MTTIQNIYSIRKDVRDTTLPPNILHAVESIHSCIKSGTDLNGWKKVDWRNGKPKPNTNLNTGQRPRNQRHDVRQNTDTTFDRSKEYTPKSIPLVTTKPAKYVSKFKKQSTNVDDTILNTILLGKLNKFSQKNYDDIKEFITHIIDNGETDMIKCFMKLVFEKAASEETFCPLYAKLLSELSTRYPILLSEMDNLYSQYMEIFDEVSQVAEDENYNEFCKRNIGNKYRRGYSQFLAELIKYDVIELNIFIKTINKIIGQIENNSGNKELVKLNEEFADCLIKIVNAIKNGIKTDIKTDKIKQIRDIIVGEISARIHPLTLVGNGGMSNKARFAMLDIYETVNKF